MLLLFRRLLVFDKRKKKIDLKFLENVFWKNFKIYFLEILSSWIENKILLYLVFGRRCLKSIFISLKNLKLSNLG